MSKGKYARTPQTIEKMRQSHIKLHLVGNRSPNFGLKRSDETKYKLSISHLGKIQSNDTKLKHSIIMKQRALNGEFETDTFRENSRRIGINNWSNPIIRNKMINSMKGKCKTKEHKLKLSSSLKGNNVSDETKRKISTSNKVYNNKPEVKAKKSMSMKNLWKDDNYRHKVTESRQASWDRLDAVSRIKRISIIQAAVNRPESKKKHIESLIIASHNPDLIKKRKIQMKELWSNPEVKNRRIKNIRKSQFVRPNKPESSIMNIINDLLPNEYKYTGDGSMIIDGLCPDFTNCNGQKKVIELFGDYWHKGENPQVKIDRYAKFGFVCLVIWERELKDIESVKDKLSIFNNSLVVH